ncbi:hypothetical protein [Methanolapillus ohkumae]|uniref:Uncharacterized protein n=1 Tax=Methanolapillus ohkumae TaxID=3028298 RepID=A0AA96VIB0_9EURY|nr:hypothetical protein MsAm2_07850 [Methanosarcinaceae archaeon Am2]
MPNKFYFCFDPADFSRVAPLQSKLLDSNEYDMTTAPLSEADILVVWIGKHTFEEETCLLEIRKGFEEKKAHLAVYLDNAADVVADGKTRLGKNPYDLFYLEYKNKEISLKEGAIVIPGKLKSRFSSTEIKAKASDFVGLYDYVKDNGGKNMAGWMQTEIQKKKDFFAECKNITPKDWDNVIRLTAKGSRKISGMFLYYYWANKEEINPKKEKQENGI